MGKKKTSTKKSTKAQDSIKWRHTNQNFPEGYALPSGLEIEVHLATGARKSKIPNPWELNFKSSKTGLTLKVKVAKNDTPASLANTLKNTVGCEFILVEKETKTPIDLLMKSADLFAIKHRVEFQELDQEELQEPEIP